MNIGIDVDGTMTDISGFMLENGTKYFGRKASEPAAFDVDEMFACTHEERTGFWKKHLLRYCKKEPIVDGAAETIRKLHEDGHRIYIVTSRVFTTQHGPVGMLFRHMLRRWLRKRGVVYDDIVFCEDSGEAKLAECRRLSVDLMIDDKPVNLITISREIPVVAHPMPWNKGMMEEGVVMAEDWGDIYDIISEGKELTSASTPDYEEASMDVTIKIKAKLKQNKRSTKQKSNET